MSARFIFLDLETTGLDSRYDQITEAAWITEMDIARHFIVKHDRLPHDWVLENTDYLTRIAPAKNKVLLGEVCMQLVRTVSELKHAALVEDGDQHASVHVVGACPAFDDRFLRKSFQGNVPYHYHVIDIEAMAMGALGHREPFSLKELRGALGIPGENPAAHTALADAREVKIIWDALRGLHGEKMATATAARALA